MEVYCALGNVLAKGEAPSAAIVEQVRLDLEARESADSAGDPSPLSPAALVLRALAFAPFLFLALILLLGAPAGGFGCGATLLVVTVVGLVGAIRLERREAKAARVSHQRRCIGCDYDLAGLGDAIPPDRLGGRHMGPVRCPECGVGWPGVPRVLA